MSNYEFKLSVELFEDFSLFATGGGFIQNFTFLPPFLLYEAEYHNHGGDEKEKKSFSP